MLPLTWLVIVTMTAGWIKIFSPDPRLGFLSHARTISDALASGTLPANIKTAADASRVIFNDRLDAAVAAFFMLSVIVIIADSAREWLSVVQGRKPAVSSEVPFEARAAVAGD
jgi:carbon starvation protein